MELATEKPSFGPLNDVKVVYSAVELAVPKACDLMADWGADVIWLENTFTGDSIRDDTVYLKQAERRNQRSVSLDYFSDKGKEVLLDLIVDADIFIEGSKGGTYARKGITDEVLWGRNPRLIIVHLSGFGQYGDAERVSRAAYDVTANAYAGYLSQNGVPEQPMNPAPYTGDYMNSLMTVSSALAALHRARITGEGESIDLAMYETLMTVGQYHMVNYLNAGKTMTRAGAHDPGFCADGVYPCKDGFLGIVLYGVRQCKYFLEAIGLGHLWGTEDIPEGTPGLTLSNPYAAEIEQAFSDYCLANSRQDVDADFSAHGIAAQAVLEFEDLVNESHMRQRGIWTSWTTADGDEFKGLDVLPKFKNNPGRIWRPMPHLGEDTSDVLRKAGYSDARIAELESKNIVKTYEN